MNRDYVFAKISEKNRLFITRQETNEPIMEVILNGLSRMWDTVKKKLNENDEERNISAGFGAAAMLLGLGTVAGLVFGGGGMLLRVGLGAASVLVSQAVFGAGFMANTEANNQRDDLLRNEQKNMEVVERLINKFKSTIEPQKEALEEIKVLTQTVKKHLPLMQINIGPQVEAALSQINYLTDLLQKMNLVPQNEKPEVISQAIERCEEIDLQLKQIKKDLKNK